MPLTLSGNGTISDLASAPTVGGTAVAVGTPSLSSLGIANHDSIVVDANGVVTNSSQAFISRYRDSGDVAADSLYDWNQLYASQGSAITYANSRFTMTVAGVYLCMARTMMANPTAGDGFRLFVNGTRIYADYQDSDSGYEPTFLNTAIKLSANDYVEFKSHNSISGTYGGARQHSYVSIVKLN